MKDTMRERLVSRALLGTAFVLTGAVGFAAPPSTTLDLTGIQGQQGAQGYSLAGIYTSPYLAEIGGSSTGTNVICDDFADDSYVPEEWNAYVTPLSQLSGTSTDTYLKWNGATITDPTNTSLTITLNQQQAYETAALLAEDILSFNPPGQLGAAIDSYAMWGLFDPTDSWAQLNSYGLQSDATAAQTLLWNTASSVSNGTASLNGLTATIYSFDSCISSNCSLQDKPQEFIALNNMPEASSIQVLGADLLAVAGLVFFLRRRIVRN